MTKIYITRNVNLAEIGEHQAGIHVAEFSNSILIFRQLESFLPIHFLSL